MIKIDITHYPDMNWCGVRQYKKNFIIFSDKGDLLTNSKDKTYLKIEVKDEETLQLSGENTHSLKVDNSTQTLPCEIKVNLAVEFGEIHFAILKCQASETLTLKEKIDETLESLESESPQTLKLLKVISNE